jgi:uncharacterized protein (DUF1684 family)
VAGTCRQFELQGQRLQLEALEESADSLMIVFRDQTSGKETYGGGRFSSFPDACAVGI